MLLVELVTSIDLALIFVDSLIMEADIWLVDAAVFEVDKTSDPTAFETVEAFGTGLRELEDVFLIVLEVNWFWLIWFGRLRPRYKSTILEIPLIASKKMVGRRFMQ